MTLDKSFLQTLFTRYFDAFVYNQIWEDPRVDVRALELDPGSRVLTISSGGCNVLNYLLSDPRSITAVDLNRFHIHLLELKLAAARSLSSHDKFFQFFGAGKYDESEDDYTRYIAPQLDNSAREFWNRKIRLFRSPGLYECSRNASFLRFLHRGSHLLGIRPEKMLEAESMSDQREAYTKHIEPFFRSAFARALAKLPVTVFGLGIPPSQLEELKADASGGLIRLFSERVRKLACDYPISENYFAWQAFSRRYDTVGRVAIPDYLKAENFETIRTRVARVSAKAGSITDEIRERPAGTFNRFVFLDAQDWMNSLGIAELWQLIAERGEPGSRIIFRTAGAASPIEKSLPQALLERFHYHREFSLELYGQDRSSIYGGFHLYTLND